MHTMNLEFFIASFAFIISFVHSCLANPQPSFCFFVRAASLFFFSWLDSSVDDPFSMCIGIEEFVVIESIYRCTNTIVLGQGVSSD